jgi:uncharacterized membrane protein YphA (DoxX/SURF4 family)
MAGNREATGLVALRTFLGVFFLAECFGKLRWLLNSEGLSTRLNEWAQNANAWNTWYLHHVAIPYVAIFARLVMLGELSLGLALMLGLFTRPAAILGFLMVLNFHFASGDLFRVSFLTNGYGLPVLGGLLALAIGGGRLPWSLKG